MNRALLPFLSIFLYFFANLHASAQYAPWECRTVDLSYIPIFRDRVAQPTPPPTAPPPSLPSAVAEEIEQLAMALGNDPLRIFNHVRNQIDYEAYHGLRKGALLTLWEGSGNDFDQCVLLAELLKAAGYTNFEFRHRGMLLDYQDLIPWLGFAPDAFPGKTFSQVSGSSIQDFFGANHNGVGETIAKQALHAATFFTHNLYRSSKGFAGFWCPDFPSHAKVVVDRLYLTLTINGVAYDLDPSYKHYEDIPGVANLLQTMGYSRATLLTAAGGGSDVNFAYDLKETAIKNYLNNLTSNLHSTLQVNYPGYTFEQIIGGKRIIKQEITSLTHAFPLAKDWWGTDLTWSTIPADYQSMLSLQTGTMNFTIPTASLQGKKLSVTYNGNILELKLDDGAPVATTNISTATFAMSISMKHPGAPASQHSTRVYKKANTYAYCIYYGYRAGARLLQQRHDILQKMYESGKSDSSLEVRTELLNIMGLTWLQQTELVQAVLANINQVRYTKQNRFGRMAQEAGFFIDAVLENSSYSTKNGLLDDKYANVFHLGSLFHSAMEHGVIEQMQDGYNAVSTVNIIRKANIAKQNIYKVDSTNWDTGANVKGLLLNYNGSVINSIEGYVKGSPCNGAALLPQNGNVSYGNWTGTGFIIRTPLAAGMVIDGFLNGGYSTNYGNVSSPRIATNYNYNPSYNYIVPYSGYNIVNYNTPVFHGSDPVNMATGAFEYSHTDIETGLQSAPRGLAFSRDYTSARSAKNTQNLGYGWTHNLHMRAAVRTATEEALGLGTAAQAAPLLVACLVGADLYREVATPQEWGTAVLTVAWFQDWMLDNAVSITLGNQAYQFLKMPDGSYLPPAGSTMSLQLTSGKYRLSQRHGNTIQFQNTPSSADTTQCAEKIIDPDGKELTFAYHSDDRINYVQDSYGRRYTFGYTNALITTITETPAVNSVSRTIGFRYDTNKNLDRSTDPEGKYQYYDYTVAGDPAATPATAHRIVRLRNHDLQTITQNIYNPPGQVTEQWLHGDSAKSWKLRYTGTANTEQNPAGNITTYHYDSRGRATGKTDANGITELWAYDGQDRLITKTTGAQAPTTAETTQYFYDAHHNLLETHHPRGGGITYQSYDALHRPLTTTDPDGRTTTHNYDVGNTKNRPDSTTDPAGTTTYLYKTTGAAQGQLWKETRAGLTTEYEYHATYAHPLWVKEPGGYQTHFNYDARGNLLDTTDANAVKTTLTHNLRRQPRLTTINSTGTTPATSETTYNNQALPDLQLAPPHNNGHRNQARQSYNPTEKPTITTFKDNDGDATNDPFTEITYDSRDWQHTAYDIARRPTSYTPYANGLLEKSTHPGNKDTTTLYDSQSRPRTATAPGNNTAPTHTTSFDYTLTTAADASGPGYPKNTITTPDNLTTTIITNRSGQTRFLKDRRGHQWETQYNAAGQVWKISTPLGKTTTHTYTTHGQPDTITEPSQQATSHTYSPSTGRLATITDATGVLTIQNYDNLGNILTQSETRNGQTYTINQTYTPVGQLQSRTDEHNQTVTHRYYPSGAKWKTIYPGGTENGIGHVEYTYHPDGKLWQVIDKLSSTTTRTSTYTWYKDGRLHTLTRPNNTIRTLTYHPDGQPATLTERDAAGKLLHFAKHDYYPNNSLRHHYTLPTAPATSPTTPLTFTYNDDNQIHTLNGTTLTHDADGNLTTIPLNAATPTTLTNATYNSRNQLTAINGISYDYDSQGHRKSTTSSGVTTTITHDTSAALARQIVRTKNAQSTRTVWGLGVLYEVKPDGNVIYHHHDLVGSTIALSDGTGNITERLTYSPYGQIQSRLSLNSTPHDTPYLFTGFYGNETDSTGLIHMRARFYSPLLHRFLNSDPAREGNNWYAYAAGNPLGFVDPSGLGIESALDTIQSTLSFLGMLPVVGAAFDLVNSGISVARGNFVDAGFHFLSAAPGIGDLAAGAKIVAGGAAAYGGVRAYSAVSRTTRTKFLNQTYRHATPSTIHKVRALNRHNYNRAKPEIVRQRSTQLYGSNGQPVNGRYNQATNQIFLGKGSNLGTLTEELIHAGQRLDWGKQIPASEILFMEKQAERQLDRLGFEIIDP